jgi:predicted transcriptional regulator
MKAYKYIAVSLSLTTLPLIAAEANWMQSAQSMIMNQMQVNEEELLQLMNDQDKKIYHNLNEEEKALVIKLANTASQKCLSKMMAKMRSMMETMNKNRQEPRPIESNRF